MDLLLNNAEKNDFIFCHIEYDCPDLNGSVISAALQARTLSLS